MNINQTRWPGMEANPKLNRLWLAAVTAFIFLGAASVSRAQSFRGALVGTVSDQTGAAIPGATVTARNDGTGFTRVALTDDAGGYNIPELPIGNYTVTAEKSGLQTVTQGGIPVDVAAERRVDMTLTAARVESTVEVHAQVPLVESTTDVLGGTIESQQVENLPVNGRDYT